MFQILILYFMFVASWAHVLPCKVLILQLFLGLNARSQVKMLFMVVKTEGSARTWANVDQGSVIRESYNSS